MIPFAMQLCFALLMHLDEEKLRAVRPNFPSINPIISIVSKGVTRREEVKSEQEKKGANCWAALYMKAAKKTPAPIRAPAPTLTLEAAPVEEAAAEPAAELADPAAEDTREEAEEAPREEEPLWEALEPEDDAAAAPEVPEAEEPEPVAAITAALRT